MNRRYLGRHIFSTIKSAYNSALFWSRFIAITLSVTAIELFMIINKDDEDGAIPVYVVGGSVDVSGSVDIDNVVEVEGSVDVNNTVHVDGMVGTY